MNNYIIKSCGTISEIIATLKTLQTIAGQGSTLSDVATLSHFAQLQKIVKNQLKGW